MAYSRHHPHPTTSAMSAIYRYRCESQWGKYRRPADVIPARFQRESSNSISANCQLVALDARYALSAKWGRARRKHPGMTISEPDALGHSVDQLLLR